MKTKNFNVLKLIFTATLFLSLFNFTSCDQVEEVSLDTGLQSITVTTPPNKLRYSRTDYVLDTTGLVVTASYRSGASKVIPLSSLSFSGFRESEGYFAQSEQIYVHYIDAEGIARSTSFTITYTDLASISITSQPTKTRYTQNMPFDLDGLIVSATYNDNSTQPIFSSSIVELLYRTEWGDGETIISEEDYNKIKSFRGRDAYNNVTTLTIPLDYKMDSNYRFVKDSNGNRILTKKIEFSGFDDTLYGPSDGQQQVIVKYTEIEDGYFAIAKETSFNVKLASLSNVVLSASPNKTHYTANTVLNFDGIVVRAAYSDGSTEIVFSDEIYKNLTTISAEKKAEIENYVGGTGKTLSIPLEWKTDNNGNYLISNGGYVPAREIVFADFNSIAHANQPVKVKYVDNWGSVKQVADTSGYQIYYETFSNISIASEPTKYKYKRGEALDLSGLRIVASYSSGAQEDIYSDYIFQNLTTLTAQEKMAVESYTGLVYDSTTKTRSAQPLTIPLEWKRDASGNFEKNPDGSYKPLLELVIDGFNSSTIISNQTVKITYKDHSGVSDVTNDAKFGVSYINVSGMQVVANPSKLKYRLNEPLALGGIVINAVYQDNSQETILSDEIFETLDTLTAAEKTELKNFNGSSSFGRKWYEQLEETQDSSNSLTIPLRWKTNYLGEYLNASGAVIPATSTDKVCVSGITFLGFNSTITSPSQTVRIRYVDKIGFTSLVNEQNNFQVTYRTLNGISINKSIVGAKPEDYINFDGMIIEATYTDNSSEVIFSKAILDDLPSGYKPSGLNTYKGGSPLEISLEKSGSDTVRKIEFRDYNSTGTPASPQTVTVTYTEGKDGAAETKTKQVQYNVKYDGIRAIQVTSLPNNQYNMAGDSATDVVGGIGRTSVHRASASSKLDDISNWHFNANGMKVVLTLNDNSTREITFTNANNNKCYGTGTTGNEAYVYKNNKLSYLQRWGKDSSGKEYKIKIEGFDPIAVFTTTDNNNGAPQTLTVSYTDSDTNTTVSTTTQISYTFKQTYEWTTSGRAGKGKDDPILLGDFPQTVKDSSVKINKTKLEKGMFKYQIGSDGNYYCYKDWSGPLTSNKYYKVEPIKWLPIGNSQYVSEKVLYIGIPYYAGKKDRTTQKSEDYPVFFLKRNSKMTVNYKIEIYPGSFLFSTVRNWLNGSNQNGDSTYDGKGFLQTAFTSEVEANKLQSIPINERYVSTANANIFTLDEKDNIQQTDSSTRLSTLYTEKGSLKVILPSCKQHKDAQYYLYHLDTSYCETGCYNRFNWKDFTDKMYNNGADSDNFTGIISCTNFAGNTSAIWAATEAVSARPESCAGIIKVVDNKYNNDIWSMDTTDIYEGIMPIIRVVQ